MISRQKYFVSVARAARLGPAKSHGNGAQFLGRMHRASVLAILHRIYRPGPVQSAQDNREENFAQIGARNFVSFVSLQIGNFVPIWICHSAQKYFLILCEMSVYKIGFTQYNLYIR
jgi:hypothetical protein